MEVERKLKLLTEYGTKAALECQPVDAFRDEILQVSPERVDAWKQLLSSIASTEASEELFMSPVVRALESQAVVFDYLKVHQEDENRHHRLLRGYVKQTFGYERKSRSLASRLFYDALLPQASELTGKRYPLTALAMIYFYEVFSKYVYGELKILAERDGLTRLVKLVEIIEKDERRHLAGIETIFGIYQENVRKVDFRDLYLTRAALLIARIDLTQKPWAFHNRKLRERLLCLGISPDRWEECGKTAYHTCLGLFRGEIPSGSLS